MAGMRSSVWAADGQLKVETRSANEPALLE